MTIKSRFRVKPHAHLRLDHVPTADTDGFDSEDAAKEALQKHREQLDKLQEVFYASQTKSLLIVLQGMDTAGKDGTIRHIFSGVNPQGCEISAFKVPTPLQARHDFLWRIHQAVPPRGMIGIFNRSHYEDVLSPRVHKLISPKTARKRLGNIVSFEEMLAENDVVILKFFLHISQEEQTRRIQSRIDTPDKRWKISDADFKERQFWPAYQAAYEDAIAATSRKHAPWFVVPSDHKWYRNVVISSIIVDAMRKLKLTYPKPTVDVSKLTL